MTTKQVIFMCVIVLSLLIYSIFCFKTYDKAESTELSRRNSELTKELNWFKSETQRVQSNVNKATTQLAEKYPSDKDYVVNLVSATTQPTK